MQDLTTYGDADDATDGVGGGHDNEGPEVRRDQLLQPHDNDNNNDKNHGCATSDQRTNEQQNK